MTFNEMYGMQPQDGPVGDLLYRQAEAQMKNALAQQAIHNHVHDAMLYGNSMAKQMLPPAAAPPTAREKLIELSSRAREHFVARMGGIRSRFFVQDTDCIYTHVVDDRVILFYCFSGKEGVTSEPVDVFPSDQLIAQFRMMLA